VASAEILHFLAEAYADHPADLAADADAFFRLIGFSTGFSWLHVMGVIAIVAGVALGGLIAVALATPPRRDGRRAPFLSRARVVVWGVIFLVSLVAAPIGVLMILQEWFGALRDFALHLADRLHALSRKSADRLA
jgi:uncharacterized membrane protein (Fun14 family)